VITPKDIRSCTGYIVDSPDGRIGTVADIRYNPATNDPEALLVHAGRTRTRLLVIPISQLATIRDAQMQVRIDHSPRITASESTAPESAR